MKRGVTIVVEQETTMVIVISWKFLLMVAHGCKALLPGKYGYIFSWRIEDMLLYVFVIYRMDKINHICWNWSWEVKGGLLHLNIGDK